MEDKKNQGKHLIIKTDKDSQEFLRYCIMRYYKKCALIIVKKKVEEFAQKMGLQYNQVMITGQKRQSPLRRPRLSYQNIEMSPASFSAFSTWNTMESALFLVSIPSLRFLS